MRMSRASFGDVWSRLTNGFTFVVRSSGIVATVIVLAAMGCTSSNASPTASSSSDASRGINVKACETAFMQDVGNTCATDRDCGSLQCLSICTGCSYRCAGPICSQNSDCNGWVTAACGGSSATPLYGWCGPAPVRGAEHTCSPVAYTADPNTVSSSGSDAGADADSG